MLNLTHLRYALEVAKTLSITKAAENLYMGQPNLSRSIRELEEKLGIEIFKRTSKGIFVTDQGEEFLMHAKTILEQVSIVESIYQKDKHADMQFSISVPRASYISCAFEDFMSKHDFSRDMEIIYKETDSRQTIDNILHDGFQLGIIRYQSIYDQYFKDLLIEKGLYFEMVCEFHPLALISSESPLAEKESVCLEDLNPLVQITHGDFFVPLVPENEVKKSELANHINKRIFIFERGSQFGLLEKMPHAFKWVSTIPPRVLNKYSLVQKICRDVQRTYKDILVYKKDYSFTQTDLAFIDELMKYKRSL